MKQEKETNPPLNLVCEQVLIRNFSHEIQMRPEFCIFFILEGSMEFNLHGKTQDLQTHDIFFLPPQEIHEVLYTSPDIHVLAMFLRPEFLETYCPELSQISFSGNRIRYSEDNPIYVSLCRSFANIIYLTIKKDTSAQLKMLSSTSSILAQLIDGFGTRDVSPRPDSDYLQQQISLLLDYMNNHYAEKISLSSAAAALGFHPQYFSVFFKKHFQMTFTEYLNAMRVNKSLDLLMHTDGSITDIALSCGFSSHKTFSAAFYKTNGMTPSAYRKERKLRDGNAPLEAQNPDYFSFFQRYWETDATALPGSGAQRLCNHLTLQFSKANFATDSGNPFPQIGYSVGRAASILQSQIQQQIREAAAELPIAFLRIRDIFSDDLFVYYEDESRQSIINWKYLDIVFDFLLDLGIKPFPEISYMPRALASKKQYAGWISRPNVSMPKSFKKWSLLITSFMEHLISRYGRKEVLTWHFDFWTSANLHFRDSYWHESKEDFFLFYRITYFSIKNVEPDILFGSPNFSIPSGISWYEDFFDYCKSYNLKPAYLSTHLYNCLDEVHSNMENLTRFSNAWDGMKITTERDTAVSNIRLLREVMARHHVDSLRIVVSDWNMSYIPRDLVRDTCFMAPHLLYTAIQLRDMVDILSYHTLSDINEDFFPEQKLFHGGPGTTDPNGLKKASYYAFSMLGRMGHVLADAGENYLLTVSEDSIQLLLFHYVFFDSLYVSDDHSTLSYQQRYTVYETSEDLAIHAMLPLREGAYRIKETRLNRHSGSAYDLWLEIGAPQELTADTVEYLKQKNRPELSYYTLESSGTLLLNAVLPPHGVTLLEIKKIESYN